MVIDRISGQKTIDGSGPKAVVKAAQIILGCFIIDLNLDITKGEHILDQFCIAIDRNPLKFMIKVI